MILPKALHAKRAKSLWLDQKETVKTLKEAKRLMKSTAICLRYWASRDLPLASMYQAATGRGPKEIGQRRAINLTNELMRTSEAIEVNVIANRLCLVHRSLVPALFRLVTRGGDFTSRLSVDARRALRVVEEMKQVTAGDVRKLLGKGLNLQEDPAYKALAELQVHLIIDRGPFAMPGKGIPYLPKEGYPYRLFSETHTELISAARKLNDAQASDTFILEYLKGALFCTTKKMTSMFKLFLSADEIMQSIGRMRSQKKLGVEQEGRETLVTINA